MKVISCYRSLLGLLYVIYGALQVYNGMLSWLLGREKALQLGVKMGNIYIPNTFPDPFSGLSLITVGLLFLLSFYYDLRGSRAYRGYLLTAWLLSITLLMLNVIEIAANVFDAYYPLLYGNEPNFEWSLATDGWGIAPHLLLGILAAPMYFSLKDLINELMPGRLFLRSKKSLNRSGI